MTKEIQIKKVSDLCKKALAEIDKSIENHKNGKDADLSVEVLNQIKDEIILMDITLNPNKFFPSYPRYVLDSWPDKYGLIDFLVDVAHQYEKI